MSQLKWCNKSSKMKVAYLANQTTTAMDEINTQVNLVNEAILE